jgi:autotransporter strand-loop-strand O-heptosyltransferase
LIFNLSAPKNKNENGGGLRKMNIKYHCEAGGETGYHAHSKAFWARLQKYNDGAGIPINIVLDTSDHPIFYKEYQGIKICYNVYESTLQPEKFFNHILNNWNYFWCPSEWQRQCTINQGFPADRVMVVPEGVSNEFFPVSDKALADKFTFIIIGKWEYRKTTEEMIKCWFEEFPLEEYPDIKLVLSVDNPFDRNNVNNKLKELENLKDPRIEILHFPPREEYIRILQKSHMYLSCSRSEGWNLPLIESIACGVPSICLDYSAQAEFAKNISQMVKLKEMRPIPNNTFPGEYGEPDFDDFKAKMKYIYENWDECRARALAGANFIKQQFSWEKAAETAYNYLLEIQEKHKNDKFDDQTFPISGRVNINFIDGANFDIASSTGNEYHVKFINKDNNSVVYDTKLRPTSETGTCWARPLAKYFINWKVEVSGINRSEQNNIVNQEQDSDTIIIKDSNTNISSKKEYFCHEYNATGKRVFINLDSKALGDNIAWMPYVEAFTKKWGCETYVTTFWNTLFEQAYPDLKFVKPGAVVDGIYAQYKIGCFDNDTTRNRVNWREVPLQKVAADILGLPYVELKTKVSVSQEFVRTGRKYVCISDHSTMQSKFWNYPGGWQAIIDYLGDLGYDVVAVSKDQTGLTKIVPINNRQIEEISAIITASEFFIGVGSGLSWLAWALNKKVIMISGFSDPFVEFQSNNYRISAPPGKCHGCFNDSKLPFDRSWNWCPRNKNFECSTTITPEMVKEKIDLLISHL